jgi:site-specific DNA-methyltransferase (adenine-specific)
MKYPEDFLSKIIHGDCLDLMQTMPENCIDLIVTSPPYNIGKPYSGYNDSLDFADYHQWLRKMCHAMYRVIKPNSNIFVNICDVGISNKDAKGEHRIGERGNFYVVPNHTVVIGEMIALGGQYLNPIIWKKPSNHNAQFGANARFCGTYPYPKNCHVPSEIEYILHFRKNGLYEKVDKQKKEQSKITKERWMQLSGQIWEFNGVVGSKGHPAQFPMELPLRCIEGWSFIEDVVLDPFLGVGTTALACKKMNRQYIGMDISKEYCDMAIKHLEEAV